VGIFGLLPFQCCAIVCLVFSTAGTHMLYAYRIMSSKAYLAVGCVRLCCVVGRWCVVAAVMMFNMKCTSHRVLVYAAG
jgi:hypothetical protein